MTIKALLLIIATLHQTIGFSQSTKSEISSLRQDYGYMLSRIEQAERNILELKNNIKNYQKTIDSLTQINNSLLTKLQLKIARDTNKITTSPSTDNKIETNGKPEKQAINYGRCKATTQKGSQCSRSAGSSGFCWQHNK
jgi:hypothetical protein